jgi:hypothetical protein
VELDRDVAVASPVSAVDTSAFGVVRGHASPISDAG